MEENKINEVNNAEESKQLTDGEIEKKLRRYYCKDFKHTREYLISNLRRDPNFKTSKGILVREDFIEQYYLSRKEEGLSIYKYDFSLLPELISNREEKVKIIVNELDDSGKIIGIWETSYYCFIKRKQNHPILGYRELSKIYSMKEEEFLRRAKEIHGDKYNYSEINYNGLNEKIKIYCNTCKKFFWQIPTDHIGHHKSGCPVCGRKRGAKSRALGIEKFIKESKERFGENKIDYSKVDYVNVDTKVLLYCNDCKTWFWQTPTCHFKSKLGCPNCSIKIKNKKEFEEEARKVHGNLYDYSKSDFKGVGKKILIIDTETGEEFWQRACAHLDGCGNPSRTDSSGERLIKSWINNNIDSITSWAKEFRVEGEIEGRTLDRVYIDFVIEYNNKIFWIEYNGMQHYEPINNGWGYLGIINRTKSEILKIYNEQIKRDKNVRDYCKNNNIILIEIPYTYRTYSSVSYILNRVILDGDFDLSFIKYPEIKSIDNYREDQEDE